MSSPTPPQAAQPERTIYVRMQFDSVSALDLFFEIDEFETIPTVIRQRLFDAHIRSIIAQGSADEKVVE